MPTRLVTGYRPVTPLLAPSSDQEWQQKGQNQKSL